MTRIAEMVELAAKSTGGAYSEAEKRQQRIAEIEYQMTNFCPYCKGLPHDLPPQCYDDKTECECEE